MVIQKDFPLSQVLWYKIGGKAKYLLNCENYEDIMSALEFIDKNNISKVVICGLGSNLIFQDDYFNGALIRIAQTKTGDNNFQKKDESVTAFAGTVLDDLIRFSFDNKLTGLEWAGGLPGTVGAGIRGNVGAFGKEINDSVLSVEVLVRENGKHQRQTLLKKDLNFSYRSSLLKENKDMIVVSATFHLTQATSQDLAKAKETYESNINYRKEHHPVEYPTCGSVFKNITETDNINKILTAWPDIKDLAINKWHGKISMGYLINRLGFSGVRKGNMQVSPKHANFIVNLGDGHASDVISIIKEIQGKMQQAFNFTPETEVEIITL